MNRHTLIYPVLIAVLLASAAACRKDQTMPAKGSSATYKDPYPVPADALEVNITGNHGGRIVSCLLDDPETFHQLLYTDDTGQTFNQLMSAGLTRMNLITQEPEPALAQSWEVSPDGLAWTFRLRKGLKWSDGQPFTAADVLFTMDVVTDPEIPSFAQDALLPGIRWTQLDEYTLTAKLPTYTPAFLRQLDGPTVPILPKHKWGSAYQNGTFQEAMHVGMAPGDYVSMGAFVLKEYKANQWVILRRNPHYWKVDTERRRLPYLDELVFLIFPGHDQIYLKLEEGKIDTYPLIRPENIDKLKKIGLANQMKIVNVGPAYDADALWFNLNDRKNPETGKSYVDPVKQKWFLDVRFRQAVSYAVNRDTAVKNVLLDKGIPRYGPESTSNHYWYNPEIREYPYDPSKSLELLKAAGFTLKNAPPGESRLYDRDGNHVRFRLYTNAGNSLRHLQCQLIADDLAKIGMQVDYQALDFTALVSSILETFDYDAAFLGLTKDDPDPAAGMNVWTSGGSLHFWNPSQEIPATPWEKRIDELMMSQWKSSSKTERKRYYDEVQKILGEQQPMIFVATQLVHVCAKEGIGNLKPVVSRHRTLWNADELFWK